MRHSAHLASGTAKEMPNILKKYVLGDLAGRNANGARTGGLSRNLPGRTILQVPDVQVEDWRAWHDSNVRPAA